MQIYNKIKETNEENLSSVIHHRKNLHFREICTVLDHATFGVSPFAAAFVIQTGKDIKSSLSGICSWIAKTKKAAVSKISANLSISNIQNLWRNLHRSPFTFFSIRAFNSEKRNSLDRNNNPTIQ